MPSSDHPRPNPRSSSGSNSQDKEVIVESLQNEKASAEKKSDFLTVPQREQMSPMRRADEVEIALPLVLEIPQKIEAVEGGGDLKSVKETKEMDINGAGNMNTVEVTEAVSIAVTDAPAAVSGLREKVAVTAMTSSPFRGLFQPTQKREAPSRDVLEEPTKKPVAARLAAWQSKIAAAEERPSVGARTSEVKVGGGGKTWTQSPKAAGRNATPGGPPAMPLEETFPSAEASSSVQRNSWKESTEKRGTGPLPAAKNSSLGGIQPTTQVQQVQNLPQRSRSPEEERKRTTRTGWH